MILLLILMIPSVAAIIAWGVGRSYPSWPRIVSIIALIVDFGLALGVWVSTQFRSSSPSLKSETWLLEWDVPWIPQWGVHFHLGIDGISLLLIVLTLYLGVISVVASWNNRIKPGFFYFNLMGIITGIIGVFLSLDLFMFYFFWELMILPMYFLISIWGHENKAYAAMKFFLFTQSSGLLMLISILGLYLVHGSATGTYTFDYLGLMGTPMGETTAGWLLLGFFAAFAVKLPVVPFHTWLPDAHTEAPTAGSIILAGLLLKTGGYGLLRFVIPLFPGAAKQIAPIAMILAVVGILYGSILALGQRDLKRMIAYTSISHLGFVLLGIFSGTELALQGAMVQMLCHGLSTGALFILVGAIQDRIHTRDLGRMGGFWTLAPRMSSSGMFFAMASLGLPGLGNFVGEFLTLLGTFQANPVLGTLASLGFIASTLYSLWFVQAVFHGPTGFSMSKRILPDFSTQETLLMGFLMITLLWIGIYPQPILRIANPPLLEVHHVYR
jgi:NADH-quinone oxidoreductase subunit M